MNKRLIFLLFAVQGALSLTFLSDDVIKDHGVIYVCVGNNVTLPWRYILGPGESLINIEWTAALPQQGRDDLIATYVHNHFLPLSYWESGLRAHLTFLPNAGVALDNVTSSCCHGNFSVFVNVDYNGSTVRARRTAFVDAGDSNLHCPNRVDELRVLQQKYNDLMNVADSLRQQNDNLTQLVDKLMTPCNSGGGSTNNFKAQSCVEIKQHGGASGVYTIYPDQHTPVQVYCDQTTDGGGWAVVQRRFDGHVDFFRNWTDYDNGFGLLASEFWLGPRHVYLMTSSQPQSLRVDLVDFDNNTAYAVYSSFNLTGPASKYAIHVEGYNGTAGDSIVAKDSYHTQTSQNMPFSTPDRDISSGHCTQSGQGCWWYNWCSDSNLNALYGSRDQRSWSYLNWYGWYHDNRSLRGSEMKIRPVA